ncbi:hypothetical protein D1AOALGA4SA_8792 [Olavius algarvensis Delta 1 endosymbiont]|nr:hypothetical protein D1AOALGA4SA_8792 [Olavius algarvensis Delta 1 endosymbiont]
MSFRLKIGIAFSSVLVLMVLIALTSWWGMGQALHRQDRLYSFNSDLERKFYQMIREEKAFKVDNRLLHSRAVSNILIDIQSKINNVLSRTRDKEQIQIVQHVLQALQQYEDSFAVFIAHNVAMQTMKSRMLRESKRLLANADALDREGVDSIKIQQLMGSAQLAEKDYILWEQEAAAEKVNVMSQSIVRQADAIREKTASNSIKLKAYRISKVASVYQAIFNEFAAEKKRLQDAVNIMHKSLERLKQELSRYMTREVVITQEKVASLKLLTIAVSFCAVFLSIFATYFLSGLITIPINQLKLSAGQIVDGNLATSVSIKSRDEIGELGKIFNLMTQRLKKSFNETERYRDHLEELVRERTLDLERENSDRQLAEAALRDSEERLSLIIEQSPMGIISWDPQFRVSSWNRASERIFGYSSEEAVGRHAEFIVPPAARKHVDAIWQGLMTLEGGRRSKNENVTQKGARILCDWYNSPLIDSNDKVIGVLSLVEDVTEQEHMAKELLKIKKLESTGVLAGGIAHDFNNILTAIIGNISLSMLDRTLAGKTRSLLAEAEKASIRAKSLTQQLLTFAKGGDPIKEATSLADIVRDSANFVLSGKAVACRFAIPDNLWLVDIDKGQISQVIQNIVLNASHAMTNGGIIEIRCANIDATDREDVLLPDDRKFVRITIEDSGSGIPADVIDKIFDPYFSTKQKGSGLGLAITHGIITKHGGRIFVNSEPGAGATFTTYLPASDQKTWVAPDREEVTQLPAGARIMVMDDEEIVRDVAGAMLTKLGHEVVFARDGVEALQLYKEAAETTNPINIVIMDLTIPGGMGGKDAVNSILAFAPEAKVLVSSGYSNDPILSSYEEYGFCGVVTKPYQMQELSGIIGTVLNNRL